MGEYVRLNALVPQALEILSADSRPSSYLEPTTLVRWREMKAERNSLLSFVAAFGMNRSITLREQRQPYGLIREDRNGRIEPVTELNTNLMSGDSAHDFVNRMIGLKFDLGFTLKNDLRAEINRMRTSDPDVQDRRIYDRLKMMTTGFWQSGERNKRSGDTVFLFSSRAIDSALNIITRMSFTAHELFTRTFGVGPSMVQLSEIIRNSQKTFVEFATMHLSLFNQVIQAITPENEGIHSFLSYYFLLESKDNKLTINLNRPYLEELIRSFNLELNSDTTYCPALVSATLTHRGLGLEKPEYKTPIHGLISWYADVLKAA